MRELNKKFWPYNMRIRLDEDHPDDVEESMESWLNTEIGARRHQWNAVYNMTNTVYYFRHAHDAMLFSLRWS